MSGQYYSGPDSGRAPQTMPDVTPTVSTPSDMESLIQSMGIAGGDMIQNRPVNIPLPMSQAPTHAQMNIPQMGATKNETQRNSAYALAANISNIVGAHRQDAENKKLRNLQFDLERIMAAMQNPDLPQNQQVINDILTDPKRRKAIEKAFDIDIFGGKSSPESKALQGALAKANAAGATNSGTAAPNTATNATGGMPQSQTMPGAQAGGQPMPETLPGGQANPTNANPAVAAIRARFGMPVAPQLSPRMQALQELIKNDVLPGAQERIKAQVEQMKEEYGLKKEDIISARDLKVAAITALGRDQAAQVAAQARTQAAQIVAGAGIARENIRFQNKITELIARGQVIKQIDANGGTSYSPGPNAGGKNVDYRRQLIKDQITGLNDAIKMTSKEIDNFDQNNPTVWDVRGAATGGAWHNPASAQRQQKLDNLKALKASLEAQRNTAQANQQKLLKSADAGSGKAGNAGMSDSTPDDLLNDYNPDDDEDK